MQKIPYGKYTKEFREEAVKLVAEGWLSVAETARHFSVPKSTLENWQVNLTGSEIQSGLSQNLSRN